MVKRTRRYPTAPFVLCAAVLLLLGAPATAQNWSGSMGIAAVEDSPSGSEDNFRSQTNLEDGFNLEDFTLRYDGGDSSDTRFKLEAWGFGDAEPAESARLELQLDSPWFFGLDYDRRESYFALQESDLAPRTDDWDITRWRGEVTWDGWQAAKLSLILRHVSRGGTVVRPLYQLNALYPLQVDLDETMTETAIQLQTRKSPVRITFEQAWATYQRQNAWQPAGSDDLGGGDPDLFLGASSSREDEQDVPTTRLVLTYLSDRVEVAGSLLWSPAELETGGIGSTTFAVAGGSVGTLEFVDNLIGSSETDSLAGNVRLGFRLGSSWTLRLSGDYRDTSSDATLLGERLLRVANPLGQEFEIAGSVDDSTLFDITDEDTRLELEYSSSQWTVWGGAISTDRDVEWQLSDADPGLAVERESDGFLFGAAWSPDRHLSISAEYEEGDFERFAFRTDAQTVDRLTLRVDAKLASGWQVQAEGRFEEEKNPENVSGLRHSSDGVGFALGWSSRDGDDGFGLSLDLMDITTQTAVFLPGEGAGLSSYDLSLTTTSLNGRTGGKVWRLYGALTLLDDSGDTWPLEARTAEARLAFDTTSRTEIAVFGQYWEYDEELGDLDDYDVTRYGVAFHWKFQ